MATANPAKKPPKRQRCKIVTTKITEPVIRAVAEATAHGLTVEQAANANKISVPALHRALQQNRTWRIIYEQIRAEWLLKMTKDLAGDSKYVQGKMFLLERRYREQFGRIQEQNNRITMSIAIPADQLTRLQETAAKRYGRGSQPALPEAKGKTPDMSKAPTIEMEEVKRKPGRPRGKKNGPG